MSERIMGARILSRHDSVVALYAEASQATRRRAAYCVLLLAFSLQPLASSLFGAAAPRITSQPASQIVLQGSPVTFAVGANGTAPLFYQWWRGSALIPNATNASYTLSSTTPSDNNALFWVVVSNVAGQVASSNATLLIDPGTDPNPPVVARAIPAPGALVTSLKSVEVLFSKAVLGVDASDLLINGVPATDLSYGLPGQFLFLFAQPASTGTVQVSWSPTHGIRDLSVVPIPFAGSNWSYVLVTNKPSPKVVINEFLALNSGSTYRDEDGDPSDWIELYNADTVAANLGGWFLTDDLADLTKWAVPNYILQPNTYLVVLASGKNRTNVTGRLHTNFKLSTSAGSYLGLIDPSTNVVSDFAPGYPAQSKDVSYGRDRLNRALVGYFSTPTPGGANGTRGAGFGPEVGSSRGSGTFALTSPFQVTLSAAEGGVTNATIYYVLGKGVPDTYSSRYTGPLTITNTTLLRVRAYVPGLSPGPVTTWSYIALDPQTNVLRFNSDLPLLVLHNLGAGAPTADSANPQYTLVQGFEPLAGRSSLTNPPALAEHGTFHLRGSSTLGYAKGSFALETQDEYGDDKHVALLGLPEESDWVLYAPNNFEPVLMHNPLAHQLYRDTGCYSSRTRFVEVFLKDDAGAPGPVTWADYNGIYVLEEKIKIGKNRVDIDKLAPENSTPPSVTGGYLLSVDRPNGEPQLSAGGLTMNQFDPSGTDMITPQWAAQSAYIQNYFNSFYSTLSGANWTNPATGYAAWVDVDEWINFHIHEVVTLNVDAFRLSGYLFKPRNDKIMMGPCWDYDRTQGSTDGRDFNPYIWSSSTDFFNGNGAFSNPWYGRMFTHLDFFQRWIDTYQGLRETVFSTNNIFAHIDEFAGQVRQAQPREQARWGVTPRSGLNSMGGFSYNFAGGFAGEVSWLKDWYRNRLKFMDTNLLARPTLSAPAGQVTPGFAVTLARAAEAGSSVVYTLDGTDPRLPGGGISPRAITGAAGVSPVVTVNTNLRVCARSRNPLHSNLTGAGNPPLNSVWSGPRVASYYVSLPALRITEIMYNPAPPPTGDTNDPQSFEYVELTNTGTNTLSLIGYQLTNGITFIFTATNRVTSLAPGERVLVVKSLTAFALRYPGVTNQVAGEYGGSLNNGGERLALIGPMAEPVLDFAYDNQWYPLSDGEGFSLVVVNENAPPYAWTNATQWRLSAYDGGSPGAVDPAPVGVVPVLVNELLSLPFGTASDAVELFNPNGADVALGGWYLTDNYNVPRKYQVPDGVSIPAGCFLVLEGSGTFGAPGQSTPFGFSSKGEEVYLFSGDSAGRLTGYEHGFKFGAAEDGVTFGRYVSSDGREHFVAQAAETLGTNNAGPRLGPVVISELMYHPAGVGSNDNTLDEFIELQNISADAALLFDPLAPADTWQVQGGVSFIFPTNLILGAGQYALVVNFDPSNGVLRSNFLAKYGVPGGTLVVGPYGGKLGNSGDHVELMKPVLQSGVASAWVLVDEVEYSNAAPWPCGTDGSGVSLQRQVAGAYGNDPANWGGALPTAGRANALVPAGAPVVSSPPVDTVGLKGGRAQFSVGACGPPPYGYQWWFNGNRLGAGTNALYVIDPVGDQNEGPYWVVVTNLVGSVTSAPAFLYVARPPGLTRQPQSLTVDVDAAALFSVTVTGTPPFQYQWKHEGTNLVGQTGSVGGPPATISLLLPRAQIADHGRYQVWVGNAYGEALSDEVVLSIIAPLTILEQPTNVTIGPLTNTVTTSNASFSVGAVGRGPLRYQWTFWGTNLAGATNATLLLSNVVLEQAGPYAVQLWDDFDTLTSSNANLKLTIKPFIVVPIQAQSVPYGGSATFSVWAVPVHPSLPLTYRWLRLGGYFATNSQPTLLVTNVTNSTFYQVVVVNAGGTDYRAPVMLTALADTDRDGLSDDWMMRYFGHTNGLAADLSRPGDDADGDGATNLEESQAGTDPTNRLSVFKLTALPPPACVFYFTAVSNKTYALEYSDGLGGGASGPASQPAWTNFLNLDSVPTNRTIWVTNLSPQGLSNRLYRAGIPRLF